MKRKTKNEVLTEIFNSDYQGLLDGTFEQKKLIKIIDKVSKIILTIVFIALFTLIFINS